MVADMGAPSIFECDMARRLRKRQVILLHLAAAPRRAARRPLAASPLSPAPLARYRNARADRYPKRLESERRSLWSAARRKGPPKDSVERLRIAVIDAEIAAQKAKGAALRAVRA
jgi:hypothetical protein